MHAWASICWCRRHAWDSAAALFRSGDERCLGVPIDQSCACSGSLHRSCSQSPAVPRRGHAQRTKISPSRPAQPPSQPAITPRDAGPALTDGDGDGDGPSGASHGRLADGDGGWDGGKVAVVGFAGLLLQSRVRCWWSAGAAESRWQAVESHIGPM